MSPKARVPRTTRVVPLPVDRSLYAKPAARPLERAETLRPFVGDPRDRCVGCRRPNGAHVIGWRGGAWAVWMDTYLAVFDARGELLTEAGRMQQVLDDPDCKVVTVVLDTTGRCRRCAYFHRGRAHG